MLQPCTAFGFFTMNNLGSNIENPEEVEELPKLSFKRLKYALKQIVEVAIPLHVRLLQEHMKNIETLKRDNKDVDLRSEQVKATKTVHLLKADLYELERLNIQVREEDSDLFHDFIKDATKDAIEILSIFMDLHSDIFSPVPETDFEDCCSTKDFPALICNVEEQNCNKDDQVITQELANLELKQVQAAKSKFETLNFLQKEFQEINALLKQFSNFVFRQRENVDRIEDNIVQTSENVRIGTEYLKKASNYKAATFPIAGAVIGGLILGPAGALAGFKIFGSFACLAGGSILGYGAGMKLKQKQLTYNEIEMKALTYNSKSQSNSTPDLSQSESKKKD